MRFGSKGHYLSGVEGAQAEALTLGARSWYTANPFAGA